LTLPELSRPTLKELVAAAAGCVAAGWAGAGAWVAVAAGATQADKSATTRMLINTDFKCLNISNLLPVNQKHDLVGKAI
jgi:hypothetical protein